MTKAHLLYPCTGRTGRGLCKSTALPFGLHHHGSYHINLYKIDFFAKLKLVKLLKEVKASNPVSPTPLICSQISEQPNPTMRILQMANCYRCHITKDGKKEEKQFQNNNNKKTQFTTTLILNIFLQLYYAGFPRGLKANLYKEIISSTIELQPLLREICLPEFSNTIQQTGHEKLLELRREHKKPTTATAEWDQDAAANIAPDQQECGRSEAWGSAEFSRIIE